MELQQMPLKLLLDLRRASSKSVFYWQQHNNPDKASHAQRRYEELSEEIKNRNPTRKQL